MTKLRIATAAAALIAAGLLSACSSSSDKPGTAATSPSTSASTTGVTSLPTYPPTATVPPATPATIPNGTYRAYVTAKTLAAKGDPGDDTNSGIWTLTIKDGTYKLACQWIETSIGCGDDGNPKLTYVEDGKVRGAGNTVWFITDLAAVSKLSGCGDDCGPADPYVEHWKSVSGGIQFSDWFGLGDQGTNTPEDLVIPVYKKIG